MKATKVNAGLAESNGRLLLGIWRDSLHVTCGLTACTPGSAPDPTLGNEYGKTLPFTFLPAIWKARPRMKGIETMMTELGKLKEFAVFSIDELRDEEMAD